MGEAVAVASKVSRETMQEKDDLIGRLKGRFAFQMLMPARLRLALRVHNMYEIGVNALQRVLVGWRTKSCVKV